MILIARIRQLVQALLDYVQKDCDSNPESQTFLYQMFWGIKDGSFDFYNQARSLFLRRETSPRRLTVLMEYPKDKAHLPCIVVREPQKTPKITPIGGIGVSDTFGVPEYEREAFTNITSSTVNLMCISDNFLESVLIGETLYALLQGARNTFEQEFTNFDFSMSEIIAENQLFPLPIIIKNLNITVDEENRFASIIVRRGGTINGVRFEPEIMCPRCCEGSTVEEPDDGDSGLYFEFAYPYVWLRKDDNSGEQEVFSNTSWQLYIGQTEIGKDLPAHPDDTTYFAFGDPFAWIDEATNTAEQQIYSSVKWKLE